jgi:apolipoprotein N-acyltransferase
MRPVLLTIVIPLVAGACIGISLPPFGIWPLAIVAIAVLSRYLEGRSWRTRLLAGLLAGIGQFSIGLAWAVQFNAGGYVVLVLAESLFVAVACLLIPPGRGRIPGVLGLLVLAEIAREYFPFGGLPLGGIALGQMDGPIAGTARLGGPLLVTGVVCLAGVGLGELVRWAPFPYDAEPRARANNGAGMLVVAVLICVAGVFSPDGGAPAGTVRVAVVQGGGTRGLDQLQVAASVVFEAALRPTQRLPRGFGLVLWPEDVVALGGPLAGSAEEAELAAAARHLHATLVVGVTEPVGATRFLNEIVAFSPAGRVVATFEKVHRVPFGEYVPYRSFFRHIANLSDIPRDAIPGTGSGMIATPAGHLAVLVSFEVFFADRGRSGVRAGGRLILVPTNTSSYSASQAPAQEIAASQLQAIEEGRDLVQAAPTGFSAVISNRGAVLAESGLGSEDVIEQSVPLRAGATIYERFGDVPVVVLAGLLALVAWAVAFRGSPLAFRLRRRLRRQR